METFARQEIAKFDNLQRVLRPRDSVRAKRALDQLGFGLLRQYVAHFEEKGLAMKNAGPFESEGGLTLDHTKRTSRALIHRSE
jgi:hypothetical protein